MERLLRKSSEEIEKLRKQSREKKLRSVKKEKELSDAIATFGILTFELTESGVDQQGFQVETEEKGLKPKKDETPKELLERAARICMRSGKSASEVAEIIVKNERVRLGRMMGDYREGQEDLDKYLLAGKITDVYKSAMKKVK